MRPLETGADIADARRTLDMTQRDLSDTLIVGISTVKRAEKSPNPPAMLLLSVECLLRRRAARYQTAVSPEERAERKFREKQRLAELKSESVTPEERAERKFREKQRLRQLEQDAGWSRSKVVSTVVTAAERKHLKGALERNAERDRVRPKIARAVVHLQALPPDQRDGQIAVWFGLISQKNVEVSPFLKEFYRGLGDGSITTEDDPRITLPPEEET